MSDALYKVLVDGRSCHGGSLKWSLPSQQKDGSWKPGKWHSAKGDLQICQNGIHLTKEPFRWYKTGWQVFEAEAAGVAEWRQDKCVARKARLLRPIEIEPAWWREHLRFVSTLPDMPWFRPDGNPDPAWQLFTAPTWETAGDAAGAAARDAAAWAAARDARHYTLGVHVCDGLAVAQRHLEHLKARWNVWAKGYALLCDVNGVLYVYAAEGRR